MNYQEERHAESLIEQGWLSNEQARRLRAECALEKQSLSDVTKNLTAAKVRIEELLSQLANQAVLREQSVRDVIAERRRQIEREGWTPEHDDAHDSGEIARAAASYILQTVLFSKRSDYQAVGHLRMWPWATRWWKPTTPRRDLVKAAALILAEIDRLDRSAARAILSPANRPGEEESC